MEKKIIKGTWYGITFITCMLILIASCKKDNKNNNNNVALGSGGPLTFMPTSGDAGTLVTINGSGFSTNAADDIVTFNGVQANVVSAASTLLVVQSPQGGSTGDLIVSVSGKKVTAGSYTYQTLSIHSVTPVNGPTGTNIQIRGAGFGSTISPAKVTVNGASAIVTSVTDTLLVAAVPANAGTGVVTVSVNGKTATGPVFTYQAISKITPISGGAGTIVTIHGTGFSTTITQNVVTFNGVSAVVKSATDSLIVVTAPAGVATGPVSVSINGERTVGPVFTVVPAPVITTLTPSSGPVGTSVTVTGSNFSPVIAENQISFNGINAVATAATTTSLTVSVPAGATTGKVNVITNNQKSAAGVTFTVQSLGASLLAPDNGLDGTVVTITGTGFSTNSAQDLVYFTGSTTAAKVTAATATQLTVIVPAGSASGVVTVKVNGLTATGPSFTHAGVITLAGGPSSSLFDQYMNDIAVDPSGNVFVSDNNHIIKITPAGVASVFAGDANGAAGYQEGDGKSALFNGPFGLRTDAQGNLFVVDQGNQAIREISPAGQVSTYKKLTDPTMNQAPMYVLFDSKGLMYVTGYYGQNLYKFLPNGLTQTLSTNIARSGIAIDAADNIYYGQAYQTQLMYKLLPSGAETTFAGVKYVGGYVDGPFGIGELANPGAPAIDPTTGNLIVPDFGATALRMVTQNGTLSTIAGGGGQLYGYPGYVDGSLKLAQFRGPTAAAVGKTGLIYVLDPGNMAVREIATH